MKAGILEKIEHLVVKEVADPKLEQKSIILRIKACSICNTDIRIYHYGHERIKLPHILGHEIAAEIAAVSKTISSLKVGERVTVTPKLLVDNAIIVSADNQFTA